MLMIEGKEFENFLKEWMNTSPQHLRLGQAFYNHFNLHKLSDQDSLGPLYELDGRKALAHIRNIVEFN